MNLMNKPPMGLKQPKPAKPPRNAIRKVSAKRAAYRRSKAGVEASAHLAAVKAMDCIACGKTGPSDAHHCRSQPPASEQHHYRQLPCAGRKSSDFDTIPLCKDCHNQRHSAPKTWLAMHGPDYGFLPVVRAMLNPPNEIDF